MPQPSHCFSLKEGKILPYIPFASGEFPWKEKSTVFLSPLPPAPSGSAENGTGDSSGLFILLTELCFCSDCENFEKSKEMLHQCTGIPEPGAFFLHQENTKQQKEVSAQAEKAEQQDRMEVGFGNETGFPFKTCLAPSYTVEDLAALKGEDPSLQSQQEVKRQTLEELQLQRDLLGQEKDDVTTALDTLFLGSTCGMGVVPTRSAQRLFLAVEDRHTAVHTCLPQDGICIY